MKNQYILGIITGVSLLLVIIFFSGATRNTVGTYQHFNSGGSRLMLNTSTGEVFKIEKRQASIDEKKLYEKRLSGKNVKKKSPLDRLDELEQINNLENLVWVSHIKFPSKDKK